MAKTSRAAQEQTGGLRHPLEVRVAQQIVRLRKEKGFTQGELARLCGLSAAYLSRVESNQAALTLNGLERMAAALEIPAGALLDEKASFAPLSLHRAGSKKMKLLRGSGSHAYQMLAADKKGKLMEPLLVEIKSSSVAGRQQAHAGEEFDYILQGTCTFYYGKEEFPLRAGDAVYYDATVPHGVVRNGPKSAFLLAVATSRDYLFHGDIQRLLSSR